MIHLDRRGISQIGASVPKHINPFSVCRLRTNSFTSTPRSHIFQKQARSGVPGPCQHVSSILTSSQILNKWHVQLLLNQEHQNNMINSHLSLHLIPSPATLVINIRMYK